MKQKNYIKNRCYFLDNNEEIKIVTKTIPHKQIFLTNQNGELLIEDYFKHQKRNSQKKTTSSFTFKQDK